MRQPWPKVELGEVLRFVPRPVAVEADGIYREIGIRSHGRGIFHKPPITGAEIGSKKLFRVEPGDFVLNIVFAWEGAVALVTDSETGMVGSHRFPTFRPDLARLDPRYLLYLFRTEFGLNLLARVSPGGAGRNRTLNRSAFLGQEIPLPPPDEQRRLVARVAGLSAKIQEARSLRQRSVEEAGAVLKSALRNLVREVKPTGILGDVLSAAPRNGWSAKCDNADDGIPVLALGAVTGFRYRRNEFKRTSLHVPEQAHFWLNSGDILITRSNTPELVGHVAIYDGEPTPCIYPDLMMRLEVREQAVERRFLWYWLQSAVSRDFIRRNAKGTSPTMKKISQGIVMGIPFPSTLPLCEQRRVVVDLDTLQARLDLLESRQFETAAEIDALLPAILDRAFKGEL